MEEKDKSSFKYNGKTYKLVKQSKEVKSCKEFCSLYNYGCEKLCVKAYNELDNPDFGLIEAVFVEVDESENKETIMKDIEIDYKKLYEEEHERYEGALERARGHHSVASHYNNTGEIQELEYIFPELKEKESEDENKVMEGKLREILRLCYEEGKCSLCASDYEKLLTWLEQRSEKFQYWKPSEEQLKALDYAYNSCPDTERGNYYEGVLETLIDDLHKLPEKQDEQTTDKIIEKARTEKQRVLLTETNGDAHINWDCRSLQDVKLLLKYGLEYIDTQLGKQDEKTNPYSGISFEYNGHIWGMCARDGGVDILLDKQLFKHLEEQDEQNQKHLELKAGHWYICHRAYCCRADHLTVKEGERFMCEKDGIVKGFVIKDPETYFKEVCAPAPMEDEQGKPTWNEIPIKEGDTPNWENATNEVDLEKETDKWYNTKASKEFENVFYGDIEECAKYFFELGLKIQKGE